jgi:hypothetical protein
VLPRQVETGANERGWGVNMGKYVDGFVVPVPKGNLEAYRRMAEDAGKVWREYMVRSSLSSASRTT